MQKNSYFIDKAQQLIPGLYYREEKPMNCYVLRGEKTIPIDELCGESGTYGKGDRIVFDFGHNHAHIKKYWGGMIHAGADTFWELHNPENEKESPYGSDCVNSYCHAWSCTPAYLLKILGEIPN